MEVISTMTKIYESDQCFIILIIYELARANIPFLFTFNRSQLVARIPKI